MKEEYLLLKNSLEKYIAYMERRRDDFFDGYIEDIRRKNEKIGIKIDDTFFIEQVFELIGLEWETHHKKGERWVWIDKKYLKKLKELKR